MPHPSTPPHAAPEEIIDFAVFEEIRDLTDGDAQAFAELINNYLHSTGALIDRVQVAVSLGDVKEIQHATHDIKSMSAMFGAVPLSELARRMEQQSIAQDLSQMDELSAAARTAFDQVRAVMEAAILA